MWTALALYAVTATERPLATTLTRHFTALYLIHSLLVFGTLALGCLFLFIGYFLRQLARFLIDLSSTYLLQSLMFVTGGDCANRFLQLKFHIGALPQSGLVQHGLCGGLHVGF